MAKVKPDRRIWGLWVQSICLLFVPWQSDRFWLRYSKFHIWPWKFKANVMAKVKPDGHIRALEFNRYVCYSFCGNRTIFGWDIANSIFALEKSRSRSRRKSTKISSGNVQVRANNRAKNERKSKKLFKSYRVDKKLRPAAAAPAAPAAAYEPVPKTKSNPRYTGVTEWLGAKTSDKSLRDPVVKTLHFGIVHSIKIPMRSIVDINDLDLLILVNIGKYFMLHGIIVLQLNSGFFLPDTFWNVKH